MKRNRMKRNKENRKIMIIVGAISILLAVLCEISEAAHPTVSKEGYLQRNQYGQGDLTVRLRASIDEEDDVRDITARVSERQYSIAQVEKMSVELSELLPQYILANNQSLEEVRNDLYLMNRVNGYPFVIEWKLSDYEVLDGKGKVKSEKTTEQGTLVELRAIMTYGEYVIERPISVKVFSPLVTAEDRMLAELNTAIEESNLKSSEAAVMPLPNNLGEYVVTWAGVKSHTSLYLLLLGTVVGIGLCIDQKEKQIKMIQEKKDEMMMDYAGIVSKLAMLLGAGMTTKNAWQRIVLDYRERCIAGHMKRPAYEEMLITYYEMQSGSSEMRAYERFGRRVEIPRFQVLTSIIGQSIKKGSQGVLLLLTREVTDAFEERKSIARRKGEEAGTKLLFPMFVMLMIVMVIIVLPAFLSLQVVS